MDRSDRHRPDSRNFSPEVPYLNHLDPVLALGKSLLQAEKPARYLGGEQGAVRKAGDLFTVALCFPDLYEIGMSNNAIRILYSALNAIPSVRCERVFAPAADFEKILRDSSTPLYTLESGIPLRDVDILAFSVGYELCATNILNILDLGGISLEAAERSSDEPVVIAGGPAITNPHPLGRFLDAVWIGEAEAGFFRLVEELSRLKEKGLDRKGSLDRMRSEAAFWMKGKKAYRAIDADFPEREYEVSFPWPSIKPVQDHGTVEIMRGCPNGCRFCHAGYFYRPQRVRSPEKIFQEVEDLVLKSGYREITLASLSSGDYPELPVLIHELNRRWSGRKISFQLPSLKVESFTLPLIGELSRTRKSGLTFAVETPEESWQRSINKSVTLEKILTILREAASNGYRLAKFYFMLGLPVPEGEKPEAESLIGFIHELLENTSFQFNVNIGTFIPKPHTPFQWSGQIDPEEAYSRINAIRTEFRSERRIKISYHSPFVSMLEGLLSRGDERVGDVILEAWKRGARLDAWEDLLRKDVWSQVLEDAPREVLQDALGERSENAGLPWDDVSVRVSKSFFRNELALSRKSELSPACTENCTKPCGVCSPDGLNVTNNIHPINASSPSAAEDPESPAAPQPLNKPVRRLVFRFRKTGPSSFLPHHAIIDLLYRALQLGNIPVVFSEGFNPLPRLEIEEPIPLGMESLDDYFSILVTRETAPQEAYETMNRFLPTDLAIVEAVSYRIVEGRKNRSLSSLYWGSDYRIEGFGAYDHAAFETILSDARLEGSFLRTNEDTQGRFLELRLRSGGHREVGFGSVFEKAFGMPYSKSPVIVRRLRQWSDGPEGPCGMIEKLDSLYS